MYIPLLLEVTGIHELCGVDSIALRWSIVLFRHYEQDSVTLK